MGADEDEADFFWRVLDFATGGGARNGVASWIGAGEVGEGIGRWTLLHEAGLRAGGEVRGTEADKPGEAAEPEEHHQIPAEADRECAADGEAADEHLDAGVHLRGEDHAGQTGQLIRVRSLDPGLGSLAGLQGEDGVGH